MTLNEVGVGLADRKGTFLRRTATAAVRALRCREQLGNKGLEAGGVAARVLKQQCGINSKEAVA